MGPFLPIKLTGNHRQGDAGRFANMLKRNARGIVTDEDHELNKTRVFPEHDSRIPKDTLYVFPLKRMVKQYNEKEVSCLEGDYEVLQAINILSTKKFFEPFVDEEDGKVRGTPLLNTLYLKKGAKVVLIHNVDVSDSLNNGAKGVVLDFIRKDDIITHASVKFENEDAGKALRQTYKNKNTSLVVDENGTPLIRIKFPYNLRRRQYQEGKKAICIQFPLRLGFAMTIHSVQGDTIPPPKTITTDFSKKFEGLQAYTVLSRVKNLEQLYLINDVYRHKIYTSPKALKALKELEPRAINSNCIGRRDDQIKILSLNTQNLIHHIEDIKCHHKILEHNLMFLGESWLSDQLTNSNTNPYKISNYTAHYLNIGNGKGITAFTESDFTFERSSFDRNYQMMKFSTSFLHHTGINVNLDVISLYRSSSCSSDLDLLENIKQLFTVDNICILCGDFNLRFRNIQRHYLINEILKMDFIQLIDHPTHKDGGIIDHLYLY